MTSSSGQGLWDLWIGLQPSFRFIELATFLLFGLCLWHAVRIGRGRDDRYGESWAPLAAMLGTFVFTWALEYRLGDPDSADSIYEYPTDFLADPGRVPLWIPMGWAFVVYIAMRTSDKLEPNWKVRPLLDGLLALNLDLSLDPIAALNGWWTWKTDDVQVFSRAQLESAEKAREGLDCLREAELHLLEPAISVRGGGAVEPPPLGDLEWIPADLVNRECRPWVEPGYSDYFGIPLRNFFAWFFIVVSFSFAFRALRQRWLQPRGRTSLAWELVAAGLAIVPALGVIALYKWASGVIAKMEAAPTQGVVLFSVVWGVTVIFIASRWFTYSHDRPFDRLLWLSPLALQAFFFYELFVRKGYLLMPELAIFIPTTAAVGVFIFGWPYLDDMKAIASRHGPWRLLVPGAGLAEHRSEPAAGDGGKAAGR